MFEEVERALRQAATRVIENVANFLPGAVVLFLLLALSLVAALVIRYALLRTLRGLDFDRRVDVLGVSVLAEWSPSKSPALLIAGAAYWTILLFGLLIGLTALDGAIPSRFALSVFQYLPHLMAALVIVIVGGLLARFLARAVLIGAVNMQVQSARVLSLAVKWLVLIVAIAMALDHIGIGRTILLLAFGIVFGGIVLTIALAVGLGAKDVVSRALERQLREPGRHDEDKLNHV